MKYKYLDNFTRCYLNHNNGGSDEEIRKSINEQLSVDVYHKGLESELRELFTSAQFSWLSFFGSIWKEPDSNGLDTEASAREFAIEYIWNEVCPSESPPNGLPH